MKPGKLMAFCVKRTALCCCCWRKRGAKGTKEGGGRECISICFGMPWPAPRPSIDHRKVGCVLCCWSIPSNSNNNNNNDRVIGPNHRVPPLFLREEGLTHSRHGQARGRTFRQFHCLASVSPELLFSTEKVGGGGQFRAHRL